MPIASIGQDTVRKELRACPEGYVVLRRMPYGKWLKRQELALKMQILQQKGDAAKGELNMANRDVTVFEFSECIVDHNLEINEGQKFDFRVAGQLDLLDSAVGNEISQYIDELHNPPEAGDLGNSVNGSGES